MIFKAFPHPRRIHPGPMRGSDVFPTLDHGNIYPAATRLALFRSATDGAEEDA